MNKSKREEAWNEASRILIARHPDEFSIILEDKKREVEKYGGILR